MSTSRIEWTRNPNSKLKQKTEPIMRNDGLSRAVDLPKKEQKKNKEKKS